jgi:hypothetical protein
MTQRKVRKKITKFACKMFLVISDLGMDHDSDPEFTKKPTSGFNEFEFGSKP